MRERLPLIVCLLYGIHALAAELPPTPQAAPTGDHQEIWLLPGTGSPTSRVSIGVVASGTAGAAAETVLIHYPSFPAERVFALECGIESDTPFQGVIVCLRILDAGGAVTNETALELSLNKGLTPCTFHVDTSGLHPGSYTAVFSADYTDEEAPARFELPLKKVSTAALLAHLDTLSEALAPLAATVGNSPAALSPRPYERLRLALATDFLAQARNDAAAGAWQTLDYKLEYVAATLENIRGGVAFENLAPERRGPLAPPKLGDATVRDGAFYAGERPVFYMGAALDRPAAGTVEYLAGLGLNFVLVDVPAPAPGGPMPSFEELNAFLDTAAARNVGVGVQLAPLTSGSDPLPAGWPQVPGEPMLDLTVAESRQQLSNYLQQMLPNLASHPAVRMAGIANLPRFKFQGDAVRSAFMEQVLALYPERHDVNQAWRSHLASLDEIQPWASKPDPTPEDNFPKPFDPMSSYQDSRPYQYDWQTFHRALITDYFESLKVSASAAAPGLPVLATLDADTFVPGETIHAPDREAVQQMMDLSATRAGLTIVDKFYAFSYPRQSALIALLRSYAPLQPVVVPYNDIQLGPVDDPSFYYRYLHTAVWEGVLCGLSASAVPADSLVFKHPRALEGYATAALDVQRLADLVQAFQMAPVDVAILFSESSKIFDGGVPHLKSAIFAYEGCSFSGYNIGFVTENQVMDGALDEVRLLVIPETPAVREAAFLKLAEYVANDRTVARVGTPIPYNEHGGSRHAMLKNTGKTVLVRGMNLPTEYLHAMDAAIVLGSLPPITRAINHHGYPLEGVKSRYVEKDGVPYLFLVNLRKEPVRCYLSGTVQAGRDLIGARDVQFPAELAPLEPMLVRLDLATHEATLVAGN